MKLLSILFTISLVVVSAAANAQNNNGQNTNPANIAGNSSTAPGGLGADGTVSDFFRWWSRRVNLISIDAQFSQMKTSGVKQQNFGMTLSGAMVQSWELEGLSIEDYDATGRNTGLQILPFTLKILADGSKQIKIAAASFRNMNAYTKSYGDFGGEYVKAGATTGWSFFNNLDFVTFTLDQNYTFQDMQSIQLDIAQVEPRLYLAGFKGKNESHSYVALRANGSIGFQSFKKIGPMGENFGVGRTDGLADGQSTNGDVGGISFGTQWGGGIEFVREGKRARVSLQSMYSGGSVSGAVLNPAQTLANVNAIDAYHSAYDEYENQQSDFNASKDQYIQQNPKDFDISNEEYAAVSGKALPVEPVAEGWASDHQSTRRHFGYILNSLDVSYLLNTQGRPTRMGLGFNFNLPLNDGFGGYNLANQYRRKFEIQLTLSR